MMNMVPGTKRMFIASFAGLLFAGLLYGATWHFVSSQNELLYARVGTQVSRAERQQELTALNRMLASTEGERAELGRYMLTDDRVTEFLELIERTAREQGLTVSTQAVTIVSMPDHPGFEALSLSLDIEGQFKRVGTFVSLVETLPFQVQISSVSVDRMSNDQSEDVWHGTFALSVTKIKAP